jgi:hypothetical protein
MKLTTSYRSSERSRDNSDPSSRMTRNPSDRFASTNAGRGLCWVLVTGAVMVLLWAWWPPPV